MVDSYKRHELTDQDRRFLEGHTVVASVSGGKDSTAMSLWLTEQGIEHLRVFADTGWESDVTMEYLGGLEAQLGPIHRVGYPGGMEALVRKKGMFPSRIGRFCTQQLKIFPINAYLDEVGEEVVSAVGIRGGESLARSRLPRWEPIPEFGDRMLWRPLMDWTLGDVIEIHTAHEVRPNPLYLEGAERVGCWPCIFARKAEIRRIAETDPARIDRLRVMENDVAEAARKRYAAKGETFESLGYDPPTFFRMSGEEKNPETGNPRKRCVPIDEVVEWSKTSRGGKQRELFALESDGCMRWGLCDTLVDEEEPDGDA